MTTERQKSHRSGDVSTSALWQQSLDQSQKLTTPWIEQVFQKRECCKFLPSRSSLQDPNQDLENVKCGCGRTKSMHQFYARDMVDRPLYPHNYVQTPEPVAGGSGEIHERWTISRHTVSQATDAFGTIEFQGGAHPHRAQYVRLAFDSDPKQIMELLGKWGIEPPKLVITVHGGIANFDMQPKLHRVFRKGLLKAAKTTGAWIITSGLNAGVVRHVAAALSDGGAYRAKNKIVTIGIAPWGLLKKRDDFLGQDKVVEYHPQGFSPKGRLAVLNDKHSYFLLVDNGTIGRYGADIILRKRLEEYISQKLKIGNKKQKKDYYVPVVCVVLEGGTCTIRSILDYVTNKPPVPVVVCDGSGRAADLVSFAHQYAREEPGGKVSLPDAVKPNLLDIIKKVFRYTDDNADKLLKELQLCVRQKNLITVFRLGEDQTQDVDHAILTALLKGLNLKAYEQLVLTLQWDRADIARSDIFVLGQEWPRGALEQSMMEALMMDRVEFVKLLLENGVSMSNFLTIDRLEELYNTEKGPQEKVLEYIVKDVVPKMGAGYRYSLEDIGLAIEKLMGSAFEGTYRSRDFKKKYDLVKERRKRKEHFDKFDHASPKTSDYTSINIERAAQNPLLDRGEEGARTPVLTEVDFKYPFNELLIWAVLTNRQEMARLMWQHGEEATAKALVACKLYKAMAKEAADDYLEVEICEKLRNYAEEFRKCSVELLHYCYTEDDDKTLQLLTYELKNWGRQTCISLAVMANNKEFLAHSCCQILLADLWHGGLRIRRNSNLKVLLGLLFPPSILFFEFKTKEELKLQPQTAAEHADEQKDISDSGVYGSDSSISTSELSGNESDGEKKVRKRTRGPSVSSEESKTHTNAIKKVLSKSKASRSRRDSRTFNVKNAVKQDATNGMQLVTRTLQNEASRFSLEERKRSVALIQPSLLMANTVLGQQGQSMPAVTDQQPSGGSGFVRKGLGNDDFVMQLRPSPIFWQQAMRAARSLKWQKKFYEFYVAPITTFWAFALSYAAFIVVFTYIILIKTPPLPSGAEWFVIAYVLSLGLEQIRKLLMSEPKSFVQKVRVYAQVYWNWVTSSGVLVFFVGFVLRCYPETRSVGRVVYCCNTIWWYIKILDVIQVHQKLGPYITMVGKMVLNMVHLCVILFIVMSTFGVVRQSITYPEQDWSWILVRNIFYKPYFMLYGEVYAPEIATCGDDGVNCVPGHWIVPIVMTAFLLVSNILLINFLIAVFNNIYIETQSQSQQIWRFGRYQQVMEYESSPFLPPPLTILCHFYLIFKYCRRVNKRNAKDRSAPGDKKQFMFDYALKLFLEDEQVERLHDFEEDTMEDMARRKELQRHLTADDRIKRTTERSEFISMKLNDLVSRDAGVKSDLRQLETKMDKIETNQQQIMELLKMMSPSLSLASGADEDRKKLKDAKTQLGRLDSNRKAAGMDPVLEDIFEDHEVGITPAFIQPKPYQQPIGVMRRRRLQRTNRPLSSGAVLKETPSDSDQSTPDSTMLRAPDHQPFDHPKSPRSLRRERCRSVPLRVNSERERRVEPLTTDPMFKVKPTEVKKESLSHKTSLPLLDSQARTPYSPSTTTTRRARLIRQYSMVDPRQYYRKSGEYTSITDEIAMDFISKFADRSRNSVRTVSESSELDISSGPSGNVGNTSTLKRAKPAFLEKQNEMLLEFEETGSRITAGLMEGRFHKQSISMSTDQHDLKDMGMAELDVQDYLACLDEDSNTPRSSSLDSLSSSRLESEEGFHQISECLIDKRLREHPSILHPPEIIEPSPTTPHQRSSSTGQIEEPVTEAKVGRPKSITLMAPPTPSGMSTTHSSMFNTPLTSPGAGTKAGVVFSFDRDELERYLQVEEQQKSPESFEDDDE